MQLYSADATIFFKKIIFGQKSPKTDTVAKGDYEQLLRVVLYVLGGNSFLKYCSIRTKKLHKTKF